MSMIVTDKQGRPIAATLSIFAAILTFGYMLPWMIGALRGKSNHWGIFAVNLLLGWTFIGWVVALVMACTSHQVAGVAAPVIINNGGWVPQQFPPQAPQQLVQGQPHHPALPMYQAQPVVGPQD